MLTPSKEIDEKMWIPNAKLQNTPCIPPNIEWPCNEEFTPELGAEKIKLYIKVNTEKQVLIFFIEYSC